MSVSELISYDKDGQVERFPMFKKLFLSLVIILIASLSFGIGRLSVVGEREPVKIEYPEGQQATYGAGDPETSNSQTASVITATQVENNTTVVGSKNSDKYHYLHCPGAKQIKESNKIVFATPEAAEAAGYILAANCKP